MPEPAMIGVDIPKHVSTRTLPTNAAGNRNVRLHYSNQALWTARAGCKQTNVRGYLAGMSELNRRGKKATMGEGVSAFVSGAPALSRHRGIRPAARNRRPSSNCYLW